MPPFVRCYASDLHWNLCEYYTAMKATDDTGKAPRFVVEVDNIDELLTKVEQYGGKILKGKYEVDGELYAVLKDSEGNPFYIWLTPPTVTFEEPESQNYYKWVRTPSKGIFTVSWHPTSCTLLVLNQSLRS